MRLMHLGLPVRDGASSLRFYTDHFDFDPATAQWYEDGTVIIRNADGFDLALHALPEGREVGGLPEFLHFGFRMAGPAAVREQLARLRADGIEVFEVYDEPTYVAFKCADPDGHRVEAYWEPPPE